MSETRRFWYNLLGLRYALSARWSGVWHRLRGHQVQWRINADQLCPGDIFCVACPDSSDGVSTVALWCRSYDWIRR